MKGEESVPSFFPEWATGKPFSIAGIAANGILIVLCILIFIPVAVTMVHADGNCFLYADTYGFGAKSVCDYCIAIAILLLLLCGLRIAILLYKLLKKEDYEYPDYLLSWFSLYGVHIIVFFVDAFLLLLFLVMACLLSVGMAHLCNSLFGSRSKCSSHDGVILPNEDVNWSFYTSLSIAEGAAWFGFILWLLVIIYEAFVGWKKGTFEPIKSKFSRSTAGASTPV